jgi:hypothetical protein
MSTAVALADVSITFAPPTASRASDDGRCRESWPVRARTGASSPCPRHPARQLSTSTNRVRRGEQRVEARGLLRLRPPGRRLPSHFRPGASGGVHDADLLPRAARNRCEPQPPSRWRPRSGLDVGERARITSVPPRRARRTRGVPRRRSLGTRTRASARLAVDALGGISHASASPTSAAHPWRARPTANPAGGGPLNPSVHDRA